MRRTNAGSRQATMAPALTRGICFGGSAGAVIGGVVGTIDWPVVGTFFGALAGVLIGVGAGVLDGALLGTMAARVRSVWTARLASAVVSSGFALIAISHAGAFRSLGHVPGNATLMTVGLLLGAALGPMIAYGVEPISFGRGPVPVPLSRFAPRWLLRGAALGGVLGGVVGLVLGIQVSPVTSPVAVVEGASFGSVSGVVLALLLLSAAVLPRLRTHL
jgi:hypothetical protein